MLRVSVSCTDFGVLCHLDIDQEFKEQLVNLVPTLLSPANLVEKEIGGAKVTCRDLLHYFKVSSVFFLFFFSFFFFLSFHSEPI